MITIPEAVSYTHLDVYKRQPRDVITLSLHDTGVDREVIQENTGSDKGKLVPTPAGELISDFLSDYFKQIVDYGFTANVEEHFDEIAADKLDRNQMLKEFYTPFHALIEQSGSCLLYTSRCV